MIAKVKSKISEIFDKNSSKKFKNNLIIAVFAGAMLLILSNSFSTDKNATSNESETSRSKEVKKNTSNDTPIEEYSYNLENKLKEILKEVKGVGNVNIMINLEDTEESVPVFNTTTVNEQTSENDSQGGVRSVSREDSKQEVVTSNGSSLMTIKQIKPNIKGVIVVAEGADDILVKEKIYSAVKTVLDISGNKVEVYSSK